MELIDLRRLTGPSLGLDGPGAIAEVRIDKGSEGIVVALWRRHLACLLERIGWQNEEVRVTTWPGGVSLMLSAPRDGLYAACDALEWAWSRARTDLGQGEAQGLDETTEAIRAKIARDADPAMIALAELGRKRGLSFLEGEDTVSLGLGTGCREWSVGRNPGADADLEGVHQIPVALVTGTNGKSTSVRLLAAIAAAAGRTPGLSTSDWVRAGNEILDRGDYSGPAGARLALRDPRVDFAALEIARGGLMRRGLVMAEADAVLITNIAADHLGEYGITDIPTLTEAKFLVARALKPNGVLVLNADDAELCRRGARHGGEIAWTSLEPGKAGLRPWVAAGGRAAWLEDGRLMLASDGKTRSVVAVADVPIALGGAARYNIANALGAAMLADILTLGDKAIGEGLSGFEATPEQNPGRGNLVTLGGVTALIDFAHNAAGVEALMQAVAAMPVRRRAVLIGHAGDRADSEIRALTRAIWNSGADLFVIKELERVLRGRSKGEIPALVGETLDGLGVPDDAVLHASSEIEAVRMALDWAKDGDLLILLTHTHRDEVMALLDRLGENGWQPGDTLPG